MVRKAVYFFLAAPINNPRTIRTKESISKSVIYLHLLSCIGLEVKTSMQGAKRFKPPTVYWLDISIILLNKILNNSKRQYVASDVE